MEAVNVPFLAMEIRSDGSNLSVRKGREAQCPEDLPVRPMWKCRGKYIPKNRGKSHAFRSGNS